MTYVLHRGRPVPIRSSQPSRSTCSIKSTMYACTLVHPNVWKCRLVSSCVRFGDWVGVSSENLSNVFLRSTRLTDYMGVSEAILSQAISRSKLILGLAESGISQMYGGHSYSTQSINQVVSKSQLPHQIVNLLYTFT